jgi:hypothetical protein
MRRIRTLNHQTSLASIDVGHEEEALGQGIDILRRCNPDEFQRRRNKASNPACEMAEPDVSRKTSRLAIKRAITVVVGSSPPAPSTASGLSAQREYS